MIDIIPNWHPIFVHFSVSLFFVAVVFFVVRKLIPSQHEWRQQWLHLANWSLWLGCVFTIATLSAGIVAFNTVTHDAASHAAMTVHRNLAFITASLFFVLGAIAIQKQRNQQEPGTGFLLVAILALLMLLTTAYRGAELVYRHGLGVMSLPSVELKADDHHDHLHLNSAHEADEHHDEHNHQH